MAAAARQAATVVKGQTQAGRQGGQAAAVAKGGKRGRAVQGGIGSGGGQGEAVAAAKGGRRRWADKLLAIIKAQLWPGMHGHLPRPGVF